MFDVIIIVDWSANARPKRGADSIWSYECHDGSTQPINHRTRLEACDHLVERLAHYSHRRVLLGFDFPLGYPAGFAAAGLTGRNGTAWHATWEHLASSITDTARNRNNRWEVASDFNRRLGQHRFWGSPPSQAGEHLPTHKPLGLPADRAAEIRLRSLGLRPFSSWQLLGAGSVGSQSLTGIPVVHHVRNHPALVARARVWPFETGLTRAPAGDRSDAIVVAEVWPSAIGFEHMAHPVKDARQVMALAHHFDDLRRAGSLGDAFHPATCPVDRARRHGRGGLGARSALTLWVCRPSQAPTSTRLTLS